MYPFGWGAWTGGTPSDISSGVLPVVFTAQRDLPEEVRAALEERKDEIHSEADMNRLVNELMLRR